MTALLVEAKVERRRSRLPEAPALLDGALQIVLAQAPGTLSGGAPGGAISRAL